MTVTIDDVRGVLVNVSTDQIPDITVRQAIRLAYTRVDMIKRENISPINIENTQLMYAAYLAYKFYLTKIARSLGSLPLETRQILSDLKEEADTLLGEIKWNKKSLPLYGVAGGVKEFWTDIIEELDI